MEPVQKILNRAEELFLQYGVRSITMDDIAGDLGVSKKTVYQYVENKRDLVNKVVEGHILQEKKDIEQAIATAENAIEEVFGMCSGLNRHLKTVNPSVVYDLQKYYPEAWKQIRDYKYSYLYTCFLKNIERGQKEGLYRTQFHSEIITKMYLVSTDAIVNPEVFQGNDFSLSEIYLEHLDYHLRGMVSEKGRNYLDQRKTI